ncbi:type II toxin-antitoxin system Phd/YefM family antitoxin [Streptomyces sp. NPDC060000]|uniref:type II toxin-antitoxin system Phd/YefM family antitoxin n=1 Tax=Streptomyces sp. NPDC060000 TaxID=3347031 RepID=UPI00369F9C55
MANARERLGVLLGGSKAAESSARLEAPADGVGLEMAGVGPVRLPLRYHPSRHVHLLLHDMSEPVIESMADVRSHLADVIDRARREDTPTIITRRGKQEAVVIDIQEYQRLREIAEKAEEAWLNQLADEAESEGAEGSVSLEEMAALLRADQG